MVQEFKRNNIYQMRIDLVGYGINDILFRVYNVKPMQGARPQVWGKVAQAYNIDQMVDDIYYLANHVILSDTILFYLGFELSGPLPGIGANCHYVRYGVVEGTPVMIQLILEENGGFSFVRMNEEDGTYEIKKTIQYLDELQDVVRENYIAELPVDLDKMNHAWLCVPHIPELSMFAADKVAQLGTVYLGKMKEILTGEKGLLDYDAETVVKYGLAHGMLKIQTNTCGLVLEKIDVIC